MSGVFMDGGSSQNNTGHGAQMGNGGDGFVHGQDHGVVVPGQNGDGGFLNNILGFNQHQGQSFISHLLGLDQPQQGHAQHVQQGQAPSQTAIWNMAWGSLKPSNLLHGITISANVWWLILFLGYICWLFVLYFIRHHDPFTANVIGTRAPQTSTSSYDRRVIDHCRGATPVRTSAAGGLGNVFVPIPRDAVQAQPVNQSFGQAGTAQVAPAPLSASILPGASPNYAAAAAAQPPAQAKFYQPYYGQSSPFGVPNNYSRPLNASPVNASPVNASPVNASQVNASPILQNYAYAPAPGPAPGPAPIHPNYQYSQAPAALPPAVPAPPPLQVTSTPAAFSQPAIQAPLLHNQQLTTQPTGSSMLALDSAARLRTIVNR